MPQMSAFVEPGSDSARQREQERIEVKVPVDRGTQTPEAVRWDVELAREWAFLGGD
jgi:hypothetical protein